MTQSAEQSRIFGSIQVDFESRRCTLPDKRIVRLSPMELCFLSKLTTDNFSSVPDIIDRMSASLSAQADTKYITQVTSDFVYTLAAQIRQKLGDVLEAKIGAGYRLKA